MLFKEVVDLWEKDNSQSKTINQFRGKIRKYLKTDVNMTIDEALNENKLFDFIFADDKQSAKGKYNALYNICKYANEKILLNDDFEFQIKLKDVEDFDKGENYKTKRNSYQTVFLNDDFDLRELIDNKYYEHLNENKAIITVKAFIGMALSTGLGKGELLKDNSNKYLKVHDVSIIDDLKQVEVNINGRNINKIIIPEDSAKYIIEYINIRKQARVSDDAFFIKMWDGYKLRIDSSVSKNKPSDINNLVLYMLKYISNSLGIEELKINDLRTNKVYHELISSKGSALNSIIRLYGYVPFVEEVYQKFISNDNSEVCIGFDFFNKASSLAELNEESVDEQINDGDEAIPETFMTISEKKKRNRKIVEELKKLYKNKCQICGEFIDMGEGIKYSEVHHIHPIGKEHNGADNKYNMIVLCPNHHKMFDLGILAINPVDCKSIIHIDKNNILNNKKIEFKHLIAETNIRYHYEHIFLDLISELKR